MWYDNSSSDIEKKIEHAAQRYVAKFGTTPDVAFVNPKDYKGARIKNIRIQSKATVMPNHIWIGLSN